MDAPILSTTVAVATGDELFSPAEEFGLTGFLAGYSGLTREAYALDLRQYVAWCAERSIPLFGARRADIEGFGRHLESLGRARATVARRLCTIACFYRYAEEEGLIATSPAVHVRRPRLDYESHATGLDRNEVGAMLVAAGLGGARDHALISLLALNGLRVSEAIGADIDALGPRTGASHPDHRPQGRQDRHASRSRRAPPEPLTWPSASAAKARSSSPPTGNGWIATPPARIVRRVARAPGSPSASDRTRFATPSSPPPSMPESRCATSKKPPATPTRAPPCATTGPESHSTDTPPTSSPPSSPAQPANPPPRNAPERAICARLAGLSTVSRSVILRS